MQRSSHLGKSDKDGVEIIHQCGSHLLTLINDILDLSKIEARKLELHESEFHFSSFLMGVAEICRIRAEQKGLDFITQTDPRLPVGIKADEKRLRQVLINLLGNAIKFTDSGSVTFAVELISNEENLTSSKIRFIVADTGVGMTPAQINKIFLPFEQVGEKKKQSEGTGLGLAISVKIAEMMGSKIEVESELDRGSKFWLDVNLHHASEWQQAKAASRGKITGIKEKKPTILVVDDTIENRLPIVTLLEPIGFNCLEAGNGQEGLDKITRTRPDLIVTDLSMPVMDGHEMIQQIRSQPEIAKVPIVVASASVFETDRRRSIAAGANAFLPKPIQMDDLLDCLENYLELEWIYETEQPVQVVATKIEAVIPPPVEELDNLFDLAMRGNITGIENAATKIEQMDAQYAGFTAELKKLAGEFQIKQIKQFIKSFRSKITHDSYGH